MANELQKISGGKGCDIVTPTTSPFTARRGRIYAIIPLEDETTIASIKEDNNGAIATVTSRSWIGGESAAVYPELNKDCLIVPDYPVTEITVEAGSVIVYYEFTMWKHLGRS
jgi:hypothetical protein